MWALFVILGLLVMAADDADKGVGCAPLVWGLIGLLVVTSVLA